jgi:O-methyltransferase
MIKAAVQRMLGKAGYEVVRFATHFSEAELAGMERVRGLTATSRGRMVGLMDAVKYVAANRIDGALVECGVWRGGSSMLAAHTLLELGETGRDLYLFDTFEGMSAPTQRDVMFDGTEARRVLETATRSEAEDNYWCYASVEAVRKNMLSTGYPAERIHLVKGKVEDTIPGQAPERIALLRLDTDWYESTRHELEQLYPRLAPHGVLIIDDYGHWQGAREAVDEYFGRQAHKPLLSRLDYTGRMMVKPGA